MTRIDRTTSAARWLATTCHFLITVCLGQVAHTKADDRPGTQQDLPGYKVAVDSGVDEFRQGNFQEAREHFARAHTIFPNARTLRGLGMSEFELRNYVESVQWLEQALAAQTRPLEGSLREETALLLNRAQAYVGEIALNVTPRTASVRVDGFLLRPTPGQPIKLEVGDHVLDFVAEGHLSERRAVKLRGQQSLVLTVTLTAADEQVSQKTGLHEQAADVAPATRSPVYRKWWLWTTIGAVVAGGVVAAVLLVPRETQVAEPSGGSTGDAIVVR